MTEQEWLECNDPSAMLNHLHDRAGERQLRLFACMCCRQRWNFFRDGRSRYAVESAEKYVDGYVSRSTLEAAYNQAERAHEERKAGQVDQGLAAWAALMATS